MADSIEIWDFKKSSKYLSAPKETDHKYRRGVLACIVGDRKYPGAALMTTAAALATGVGMVRYFGPRAVSKAVIQFRPSVVISKGKIDALLIGSGIRINFFSKLRIKQYTKITAPKIIDAGAIEYYLKENFEKIDCSPTVITQHAGELSRLLGVSSLEIDANPQLYAQIAARNFQVTVLLKGWQSVIANSNRILQLPPAPTWLATAGTGDVLAGILGALVAINCKIVTESNLIEIAATACMVHAEAAKRSSEGPIDIEKMINEISGSIQQIISR